MEEIFELTLKIIVVFSRTLVQEREIENKFTNFVIFSEKERITNNYCYLKLMLQRTLNWKVRVNECSLIFFSSFKSFLIFQLWLKDPIARDHPTPHRGLVIFSIIYLEKSPSEKRFRPSVWLGRFTWSFLENALVELPDFSYNQSWGVQAL